MDEFHIGLIVLNVLSLPVVWQWSFDAGFNLGKQTGLSHARLEFDLIHGANLATKSQTAPLPPLKPAPPGFSWFCVPNPEPRNVSVAGGDDPVCSPDV